MRKQEVALVKGTKIVGGSTEILRDGIRGLWAMYYPKAELAKRENQVQ